MPSSRVRSRRSSRRHQPRRSAPGPSSPRRGELSGPGRDDTGGRVRVRGRPRAGPRPGPPRPRRPRRGCGTRPGRPVRPGAATSRTWPTSGRRAAARRRGSGRRCSCRSIAARGDVDERRSSPRRARPPGWSAARASDASPDVVGVGEEEPRLHPHDERPRGRPAVGVRGRRRPRSRPGRRCAGTRRPRSAATSGRAAASIETAMPMTRPGSVSKTSTPSIAATAAAKSARAARP